jgi:hypothetical protein
MDSLKAPITGSMTLPLVALVGLLVVALALAARLHDPARLKA